MNSSLCLYVAVRPDATQRYATYLWWQDVAGWGESVRDELDYEDVDDELAGMPRAQDPILRINDIFGLRISPFSLYEEEEAKGIVELSARRNTIHHLTNTPGPELDFEDVQVNEDSKRVQVPTTVECYLMLWMLLEDWHKLLKPDGGASYERAVRVLQCCDFATVQDNHLEVYAAEEWDQDVSRISNSLATVLGHPPSDWVACLQTAGKDEDDDDTAVSRARFEIRRCAARLAMKVFAWLFPPSEGPFRPGTAFKDPNKTPSVLWARKQAKVLFGCTLDEVGAVFAMGQVGPKQLTCVLLVLLCRSGQQANQVTWMSC